MAWRDKRTADRGARAAALSALPPSLQWNFDPKDAAALQDSLVGRVTIPSDADYPEARQVFSRAFQNFPQMIVFCDVPADVSHALAFARKHSLVITVRSGGHSTAGYSMNNGLVIDVGGLDSITVDRNANTMTVGAGALFGHVNSTMDSYGVHLPGGSCDGVGVGGYVQGGGYGYTSLIFGMNVDHARSAKVLSAERGIVECDAYEHADLFWAILGGGACGSFGVLLEVTYELVDLGAVTGFALRWDLEEAGEAMALLQDQFTGADAPCGIGYQNTAGFVDGTRSLLCLGMYQGDNAACREVLAPLLETGSPDVVIADQQSGYTDAIDYVESQFPPGIPNVAVHTPTIADSRYVTAAIGVEGWSEIMGLINRAPDQVTFLGIEPYGGPITQFAADATSFVHRDPGFDIYVWVFWTNDEQRAAAEAFLDDYREVLGRLGNGRAYQNYPSATNDEYLAMYYDTNLPRLQTIKAEWDPNNVFHYGQTIPLP